MSVGLMTETVGPSVGPADGRTTRARAEEIVRAIRKPRKAAGAAGNELPSNEQGEHAALPGFGPEYDECGEDVPHFCADCGEVTPFGRTCYRATCGRCAQSWARRQGKRIASKLDAVRRYLYVSTAPSVVPKFHHLVFSPPTEWFLLADTLDRTQEVVSDMMDALGLHGVSFYHSHRGKDGDDRGEWKKRLFSGRSEDEVMQEVEFSPHFHVIGVSENDECVDVGVGDFVNAETDWVITRLQDGNGVSISDDYDLARKVTYCLSHTSLAEDEDGDVSACYRYLLGSFNEKPLQEVTADEDAEARMDSVVRSVAPETLGLDYNTLACGNERRESAEYRVSTAKASASRNNVYATSGAGDGVEQGDDGDEWDTSLGPAETSDGPEDVSRCEGRMLHIKKADRPRQFLNDPEWRENAPKADETEGALREFEDEGGVG